jgi:maltose O-acetyltransferase
MLVLRRAIEVHGGASSSARRARYSTGRRAFPGEGTLTSDVRGSKLISAREGLERAARRALQRLRGDQNLERLVAQGLELGRDTYIARGVYLDPGHPWLISIGDETGFAPGVIVLAHDASMKRHMGYTRIARVEIGKRVFVGAGAIILPGSRVGDDAIVGAGAVVRGIVPPGSLIIGNPGKVATDVASAAQWNLQAAKRAPVWPHDGWTVQSGITAERKRLQREALADGISGYLAASTVMLDAGGDGDQRS